MLLYNDKQWPLLWIYCDNKWNDSNLLNEKINKFEFYLNKAISEKRRLLHVFKCIDKSNPPMAIYMKIIVKLFKLKPLIKEGLEKTIIWCENKKDENMINMVLKFYTPIRPIIIVRNEEELKNIINTKKE